MYSVRADTTKNRMYLTLEGFLLLEEAQNVSKAIKAAIDRLQPGFDIITDIRNFQPSSPEVTALIAENQIYAIQHGVDRTVRIVQKDALTTMQWERVSQESGAAFTETTSLEQAEALLDE